MGIQTYQILTNDDEVCIPSLSSILLAVCKIRIASFVCMNLNLSVFTYMEKHFRIFYSGPWALKLYQSLATLWHSFIWMCLWIFSIEYSKMLLHSVQFDKSWYIPTYYWHIYVVWRLFLMRMQIYLQQENITTSMTQFPLEVLHPRRGAPHVNVKCYIVGPMY